MGAGLTPRPSSAKANRARRRDQRRPLDTANLQPMVQTAIRELEAIGVTDTPGVVLADAGYWKTTPSRRSPRRASRRWSRRTPTGARNPGPVAAAGATTSPAASSRPTGARSSLRRQGIVGPVFGQVKSNRGADRFLRRGRSAVRSEWRFLTATHNLSSFTATSSLTADGEPAPRLVQPPPVDPPRPPRAKRRRLQRRPVDPPGSAHQQRLGGPLNFCDTLRANQHCEPSRASPSRRGTRADKRAEYALGGISPPGYFRRRARAPAWRRRWRRRPGSGTARRVGAGGRAFRGATGRRGRIALRGPTRPRSFRRPRSRRQ